MSDNPNSILMTQAQYARRRPSSSRRRMRVALAFTPGALFGARPFPAVRIIDAPWKRQRYELRKERFGKARAATRYEPLRGLSARSDNVFAHCR